MIKSSFKTGKVFIKDQSVKLHSVRSHVVVQDKAQAEIRFHYNFEGDKLTKIGFLDKRESLSQDLYFLFPGQWHINENTYPPAKFFSDMLHHLRFREPYVKFSLIMPNESKRENPFMEITRALEGLKAKHTQDDIASVQRLIRAYGAGYSVLFSKRVNKKIQRLEYLLDDEGLAAEDQVRRIRKNLISIDQTIRKAYGVMRNWRSLLAELFRDENHDFYEPIYQEFTRLNDYCSTLFIDALGGVFKVLSALGFDGAAGDLREPSDKLLFTLKSHLRLERRYQRKQNFRVASAKNRIAREYALSRYRALKRQIWSALYTKTIVKSKSGMVKHFGPALAAGFAALWAFAANIFVLIKYPEIVQGGQGVKTLLGANGLFAISVIVLAYVVKDRIKEIGRGIFKTFMPNGVGNILDTRYEDERGRSWPVCNIREHACYEQHSELPIKVFDLFKRHSVDLDINLAERSSVLHVHRDISFDLQGIREARTPSSSLSDILRVNFERFQAIMGDPKKQMFLLDEDGEIVSMRLPKVYYCDLVIVTHSHSRAEGLNTHYQIQRVVMNKKGLVRCDLLE